MRRFKITVDGVDYSVTVEELETDGAAPVSDSSTRAISNENPAVQSASPAPAPQPVARAQTTRSSGAGSGTVQSPLSGSVIDVMVKPGQTVTSGTPLLSIEAMKMESQIVAPTDGTIQSIEVVAGQSVNEGQVLLTLTND